MMIKRWIEKEKNERPLKYCKCIKVFRKNLREELQYILKMNLRKRGNEFYIIVEQENNNSKCRLTIWCFAISLNLGGQRGQRSTRRGLRDLGKALSRAFSYFRKRHRIIWLYKSQGAVGGEAHAGSPKQYILGKKRLI